MVASLVSPSGLPINSIVPGCTLVLDDRSASLLALDSRLVERAAGRSFFVGCSVVAGPLKSTLGDDADSLGKLFVGTDLAFADHSFE